MEIKETDPNFENSEFQLLIYGNRDYPTHDSDVGVDNQNQIGNNSRDQ